MKTKSLQSYLADAARQKITEHVLVVGQQCDTGAVQYTVRPNTTFVPADGCAPVELEAIQLVAYPESGPVSAESSTLFTTVQPVAVERNAGNPLLIIRVPGARPLVFSSRLMIDLANQAIRECQPGFATIIDVAEQQERLQSLYSLSATTTERYEAIGNAARAECVTRMTEAANALGLSQAQIAYMVEAQESQYPLPFIEVGDTVVMNSGSVDMNVIGVTISYDNNGLSLGTTVTTEWHLDNGERMSRKYPLAMLTLKRSNTAERIGNGNKETPQC